MWNLTFKAQHKAEAEPRGRRKPRHWQTNICSGLMEQDNSLGNDARDQAGVAGALAS